ncbi:unnamed protein product, partial [Prorocentrum cordatum]
RAGLPRVAVEPPAGEARAPAPRRGPARAARVAARRPQDVQGRELQAQDPP